MKEQEAQWINSLNRDAPQAASEFAEVREGHRVVMGFGSEACWNYGNTYGGKFDYQVRELMKVYVDHGIPIINPSVIYSEGHDGSKKTRGHFSGSWESNLALTKDFLVTARITKTWAAMIEAKKCVGQARQEKNEYVDYISTLPEWGSSNVSFVPAVNPPSLHDSKLLD